MDITVRWCDGALIDQSITCSVVDPRILSKVDLNYTNLGLAPWRGVVVIIGWFPPTLVC